MKSPEIDEEGFFYMIETKLQTYMAQAIALAKKGRFTVSPNPMVGCLLVKQDQVIASGWHQRAGEPHAEALALREAGEAAKGAVAFVTLEPCCHIGRTPPCTTALIDAGVKAVYLACLDPNPVVAGKGAQILREAGIQVHCGLLEKEAAQLNEIFFHYIQHRRPFVLAKWAMSLDGQLSTQPGDAKQISSPESQQHTHQLRRQVDAILIGSHTAIQDNPQLTVRLPEDEGLTVRQPLRIVVSSQGELPLDLKLFDGCLPGNTLVATTKDADPTWCKALSKKQVTVLRLPSTQEGRVSLTALLDDLGQREVTSLLVEGGRMIHDSFFKEGLVNKLQVYLAPAWIGSLKRKQYFNQVQWSQLGQDLSISVDL